MEPLVFSSAHKFDRRRILQVLQDTATIKTLIGIMYQQYMGLKAEIMKNERCLNYSVITCEMDCDTVRINMREATPMRLEFPTTWISDPNWLEQAKAAIQLEYERLIIHHLDQ